MDPRRHNPLATVGSPPALTRLTGFAEALGWTPATIERAVAAGRMKLEILRVGPGQVRYVKTADALRILNRLKEPTDA